MIEAVRTTASPAAIWTICVVALGCLAFWLVALAVADKNPLWRHWQTPHMPGPVLGGVHVAAGGRSVSPSRDAPAVLTEPAPEVPAQRGGEPGPAGAHDAVPAQRGGEADQAAHSAAGPGAAEPR